MWPAIYCPRLVVMCSACRCFKRRPSVLLMAQPTARRRHTRSQLLHNNMFLFWENVFWRLFMAICALYLNFVWELICI